jgi:DNA-binding transcriptional regulator LsrR (DeoR family)
VGVVAVIAFLPHMRTETFFVVHLLDVMERLDAYQQVLLRRRCAREAQAYRARLFAIAVAESERERRALMREFES